MSTGESKDVQTTVKNTVKFTARSTMDICYGCRKFCTALISSLAHNRYTTVGVISLPMIAMTAFLIYLEVYIVQIFRYNYNNIYSSPVFVLAGITYLFGLLGMLSVRYELQNLLRFCAYIYRSISDWIIISILLIFILVIGYLPSVYSIQVLTWSILPAAIWLFTAEVMRAHSNLITAAIENRATAPQVPQATQASTVQFN